MVSGSAYQVSTPTSTVSELPTIAGPVGVRVARGHPVDQVLEGAAVEVDLGLVACLRVEAGSPMRPAHNRTSAAVTVSPVRPSSGDRPCSCTPSPAAGTRPRTRYIADLLAATGTAGDPAGYGQTVARELFPDVLSYVVGTPATYGYATRNGRTLADNAPEAMLSLVANTAVPSGLKPAVSEQYRAAGFPYVVPA
jgi:hypothetical protein